MDIESEENINDIIKVKYNLRFVKGSKGKEILIQNDKYKFFCHNINLKSDIKKWRCCEYKNITNKNLLRCNAYFTTNTKNEFLEDFISEHNGHQTYEVQIEDNETRNIIYNKIDNISNKYNIDAKALFNEAKLETKNLTEFNKIKFSIYKNINKYKINEPDNFDEIKFDSQYFLNKEKENCCIYHDDNNIILQTDFMAKIQYLNNERLYFDGTFKISPSIFYQIGIVRIKINETASYLATAFVFMRNKTEESYKTVFNVIKNNIQRIAPLNSIYTPKYFHCDKEIAIINAAKSIYTGTNIQLCYFHYSDNIRNKLHSSQIIRLFEREENAKLLAYAIKAICFVPLN